MLRENSQGCCDSRFVENKRMFKEWAQNKHGPYHFFSLLHRACCYNCCFIPTHAHIYILKHKFTLIFKTLRSTLKTF